MMDMSWQAAYTLVIVGLTLVAMVRGFTSPDVVMMAGLFALAAVGVLTPAETFSGFSNEALWAVGVMAIVAFTSIVRGLWQAVNASIKLDGGEMIVFQAGIAGDFLSILDEDETKAKLLADPAVEKAA